MKPVWFALAVLALLGACGEGTPEQTPIPPDSTIPAVTPAPGGPDDTSSVDFGDLPEADRAVVEAAMEDLAERMDADVADVSLVTFQRLTWNDGSLGCPEPGMMYTQALVEGSLTVLELDDSEYSYHAGADDAPFLCEESALEPGPDPSATAPSGDDM